ncbi:hypothetical protein KIN20_003645 [Parelaphostrongylus tenuis]|uniref:SH3 domain-containing protein n=1 Tax=Parelaphostrongylus tenuis TaxID=148309 RepID=A0AAD5QIR2_PARTN|nr:hypothetical protein KIN20_003645 [Parelaphostrongylus tenuis]
MQWETATLYIPETTAANSLFPQHTQKQIEDEVPPLFSSSDCGRTLTVTEQFNAKSGEQMTVNPGDKVVLIKNGTRGWIFVRDMDSRRTGWIPAPYVNY